MHDENSVDWSTTVCRLVLQCRRECYMKFYHQKNSIIHLKQGYPLKTGCLHVLKHLYDMISKFHNFYYPLFPYKFRLCTSFRLCNNIHCKKKMYNLYWLYMKHQSKQVQCTLNISRLVGSKQWHRNISGSAIYDILGDCHEPKSGSIFQRVVSYNGAFACLMTNSECKQCI